MPKLFFASLVTLSLLTAMVAGVVIAALTAAGALELGPALLFVFIINVVIFLISPWLTDLMLRWINKVRYLDDDELKARYPHVHAIVHDVARQYRFKAPYVGIIPDRNPTAFTYGLLRSNARIVVTDGIFEFLNEEETRAVVAHELGHIVHRDFLVMTAAGMLVQMLYVIYSALTRSSGGNSKNKGAAVMVGITAYVMYVLGTYILLYLSRTREYLADSFSAEWVEARHLANALVKIAYGIATVGEPEQAGEEEGPSRQLLASTRHLGVVDFKGARHLGHVVESAKLRPEATAEAMLFDIYNPWSKLVEISSTHPLTGKRIQALAGIAHAKQQKFEDIDVAAAARRAKVDPGALWSKFLRELRILLLPFAAAGVAALAAVAAGAPELAVLAVPVGILVWLFLIPVIYPSTAPVQSTVVGLMGDVAASPVIGRPVRLQGEVIGRADAGSVIGEDTIFADQTGRTMVDFRSMLGPLGDMWTGWQRVKGHIGQKGEVTGWFRRSMGGYVIMDELKTPAGRLKAYPYISGITGPIVLFMVIGLAVLLFTYLG